MPKTEIDYSKIVIYKIKCNDPEIIEEYYGSSVAFTKRKNSHKHSCNIKNDPHYNEKKYVFIRNNGGWVNWTMIEVEKFPCNDGNEAKAREQFWIDANNAKLNQYRAMATPEQKKADETDYNKLYKSTHLYWSKQYYQDTKLKKQELHICDCGKSVQYCQTARHKKSQFHVNYINLTLENLKNCD